MLKHRTENLHRKVLRKVRKHFVAVTVAGGVVGGFGVHQASAQQEVLASEAIALTNQHQNNESVAEPIPSEAKLPNTASSPQTTDERNLKALPSHDVSHAEAEDKSKSAQTAEEYSNQPEVDLPNPESYKQNPHNLHQEEVDPTVSSYNRVEDTQVDFQTVDNFNHQPTNSIQSHNNIDAPPQNDIAELEYLQGQNLDSKAADEALPVSDFYSHAEPTNSENQSQTRDSENGTGRATIVHTNDIHGRIDYQGETDVDHGIAYIDSVANYFRQASDEFILLDAGDTIHGTTTVNQTEGQVVVELMNELGYEAMAPGNHEFNYGADRLIYLAENEMNFPVIAANVVDGETGELIFDPFIEWQVFGNNIGIIGLGTPDTYTTTHPDNVVGVDFTDSVQAIKDVLETNGDSFDYVIVLSHIGLGADREIAEEVGGIDLIIGGHSHTPIPGGELVNGTVITQAWEHGKTIGTVHLDFVDRELVSITPELVAIPEVVNTEAFNFPAPFTGQEDQVRVLEGVRPSATIQAYVDEAISTVEGQLDANVIGYTNELLNGERADVRTGSTNLGGLVTDSMRDFVGTDIAVVNGVGIRASIQPGEISQLDVLTVLPFINLLGVQELPGSVILEALEWGGSELPETKWWLTTCFRYELYSRWHSPSWRTNRIC